MFRIASPGLGGSHIAQQLIPSCRRAKAPTMHASLLSTSHHVCARNGPSRNPMKSSCSRQATHSTPLSLAAPGFWASRSTWRRAAVNTLRCLAGCTLGDFSSMWYLQAFYPDLGMGTVMGISMASGISTSLMLETTLLHFGRDRLPWTIAVRTAAGMSMISMITMELAENTVDYHLTGGLVQLDSPEFWAAALLSMSVGFLAPMPYNYIRLRKYGKACH